MRQKLEAEAAAQLYCSRSAGSEALTRTRRRRAKITRREIRIEPGQVRNIEQVEDLEEPLNLESFMELEGLGYSNVFRLEVVTELEVGWHNQRLDSSALCVWLPGQGCIELVDQLEKLTSPNTTTEVIDLEPR